MQNINAQTPFSILIPVYQGAKYLKSCLDSILAQSYPHFEIVLADDGSTDASHAIIESYSDSRIHLLPTGTHLGLFGNLNKLIKHAQYPLIRIFCQDDVMEPNCLEQTLKHFIDFPSNALTFCNSHEIDENSNLKKCRAIKTLPDVIDPVLAIQHFFYNGCIPGNLSTVTIKKEVFNEVGVFNLEYQVSGDYEMWTRVASLYSIGAIAENLVQLRSHPDRLSAAKPSKAAFVIENKRIRMRLTELLPITIRPDVLRYERIYQSARDGRDCLVMLKAKNFTGLKRVIKELGWAYLYKALFYWVYTLNLKINEPKVRWIYPRPLEDGLKLPGFHFPDVKYM